MAKNYACALLLTALLLSTAAALAHGAGIFLNGLTVSGHLCCTSAGNCPGQGVGGAPILLNCTSLFGGITTAGRTTTSATGVFKFTVPLLGLILGDIIPCTVGVQLPLEGAACPVLSTATGFLSSAVQPVGTVVSGLLGLVQNATITGFTHGV